MYVVLENTTSSQLKNFNKTGMNIFPNPNNGTFSIELPNLASKNYVLEIKNMLGQKIWEMKGIQQNMVEVNLNKISPDLLIVALKQDDSLIKSGKIQIN
jgi:hypothetical protein